MTRRQHEGLRALTEEGRATLAHVPQRTSGRYDEVRRVAARAAGYPGGSAVHALVKRFNACGLATVSIAPGRGPKPTYDAATRARVVALAQRSPDRKWDGTATWSLNTLELAVQRKIAPAPKARVNDRW